MPEPSQTSPDPAASDDAADRTFPDLRRGYDPDAVRNHLAGLVATIRALRRGEEELHHRLDDAEARAAAEPVLDEETLTAAVGAETAKVLRSAHEAARDVVSRAEARVAEMQAEASTILGERTREAEAESRMIAARARAEAAALVESTKAECRTMVEEAHDARRRILSDLAEKRRTLHLQLEQLRAGKDALAEVVRATARSVDDVLTRLGGSEVEAHAAADQAAQYAAFDDEVSLEALVEESFVLGAPPAAQSGADADGPSGDAGLDLVAALIEGVDPSAEGQPRDDVTEGTADTAPSRDEQPEVVADEVRGAGEFDQGSSEAAADAAGPDTAEITAVEVDEATDDRVGDVVVAEPSSEEEHGVGATIDAPHSVVDDLFARIRAAQPDATPEPGTTAVIDESPSASKGEVRVLTLDDDTVGSGSAHGRSGGDDDAGSDGHRLDGDEEALATRDELLAPVLTELARTVKRELRSDQNVLLDALRGFGHGAEASELVPGDATTTRIAAAATSSLAGAFRAGRAYGSDEPGAGSGTAGPEVSVAARELAAEVVTSLRGKLEDALGSVEDDGTTAELVGAAYRQWRGERVDDLVAHYGTMMFAVGVIAGAPGSSAVRWVVDDGKDPCPDCDDNALAGAVRAGETFPTGHAHPPVHPGCRCMLVPTDS